MLTKPSYYGLVFTGFISLIVIILFIQNYRYLKALSADKLITVVSLVGIVVGVHSLLHLGLESVYNFNPIEMLIST